MRALLALALVLIVAPATAREAVDLELVIAVDVSASMDREEFLLQRAGYIAAIRDTAFIAEVANGAEGRIALTYVEWSGVNMQRIVVPWRLIDGAASASAFANELAASPFAMERGTSISLGLMFSATLFNANPFDAPRRVIDVSGDGPNNYGPAVTFARDFIVAKGIVINGLPILIRPSPVFPDMDRYYAGCVIGGDGAFMQPVRGIDEFPAAIRRKLLQEVRVARNGATATIVLASAAPPVDCLVGERLRELMTDRFYPGLDN